MIHYDERVGCVAVYRGEERNCLSGIKDSPDCIFYGSGKRNTRPGGGLAWYVPFWMRWRAKWAYWRALRSEKP